MDSNAPLTVQPNGLDYHYYITGDVGDPGDYIELFQILQTAGPTDVLYLHINTGGGRLDSTVQIIGAIQEAQCQVVGCAEGEVLSAGTILFLACPNLKINPHSYFMFHDAEGGNSGKVGGNLKAADCINKVISSIYHDVYYPFLSKKEIKQLLKGEDFWFGAEEMEERINKAIKIKEEELDVQATDS